MSVSPHLTSLPQPTGRDTLGSCVEKDAQGQQASASQSSAVSEMDAGRGSGHTHAHTHTHTHTHASCLHKAVKQAEAALHHLFQEFGRFLFLSTFQPFLLSIGSI